MSSVTHPLSVHVESRSSASSVWRCLPHAVVATALVVGLPGAVVWTFIPGSTLPGLALSSLLAVALSSVAARLGAALWSRRPQSRDLLFADLMLWGWLRRVRTERRLRDVRQLLDTPSANEGDVSQRLEILTLLSSTLEARDSTTAGHSQRVARHAERIALLLGLPASEVARIRTAAVLHDVGKLRTPREVLNKPGRLTADEFAIVKRHPGDGAAMLVALGDQDVVEMVRHHHERLDGSGYPDSLTGESIPLGARIIAVADTFDAITSTRSYRSARPHKRALDVLRTEAGAKLDRRTVDAFLDYYEGRRAITWSTLVIAMGSRMLDAPWRVLRHSVADGGIGIASRNLAAAGVAVALAAPAHDATIGTHSTHDGPVVAVVSDAVRPATSPVTRLHPRPVAVTPASRRHRTAGRKRRHRIVAKHRVTDVRPARPAVPTAAAAADPRPTATPPATHTTPQATLPVVKAPQVSTPAVQTPHVTLPAVTLPVVSTPPVDVPAVTIPSVSSGEVSLPRASTPAVETPHLSLP